MTDETPKLLKIEHVRGGLYKSVKALRADSIDYVVIDSYLVTKGYKKPPPKVYRWVKSHGRLFYGFKDRSSSLLGVWQLQDRTERATLAPEVVGGGGVANPWLGPAFLVLMATNVVIYFFLRWMQGQLLKNDQSLLENEKSLLLKLWEPDRQRGVDKRA